jgi:multiple sugar transport system substrate-binding protein
MTTLGVPGGHALSRRGFLGLTGAAALPLLLAGCGAAGGKGSSSLIKFWDMPWGQTSYNTAAKAITTGYHSGGSLPDASYQIVQWANFNQTFASAIASKTGPAVSSGGAFQAYIYSDQGAIAYADDVIDSWKKSGFYDDFLPGTIDALNTSEGYVGVPWQLQMRVPWYRKSLFEKAGVEPPTDWDSILTAGKALKKIDVYGFAAGAGTGNVLGNQAIVSLMINNGGGLYNADGQPDAVTERNIETLDFIRELAGQGIIDPGAPAYTTDNVTTQWKGKHVAFGIDTPGLDQSVGESNTGDLLVPDPIVGPHGDTGTLVYVANLMMYANTPSQEGSEAFLTYFLQNMHTLWSKNVIPAIPVLKSIAEADYIKKNNPQYPRIIEKWQPIAKGFGAVSTKASSVIGSSDGSAPLLQFAQSALAGKTDSKTVLTTLQAGLESLAN